MNDESTQPDMMSTLDSRSLSHLNEILEFLIEYPTKTLPNLAMRFYREQKANPTLFNPVNINEGNYGRPEMVIPALVNNERKHFQVENWVGRIRFTPYGRKGAEPYTEWHKAMFGSQITNYTDQGDIIDQSLRHIVNRIYFQAIRDIAAGMKAICDKSDCDCSHPIKLEPSSYEDYDEPLKDVISKTLKSTDIEEWIRIQLEGQTDDRIGDIIESVAKDDPAILVDAEVRNTVKNAEDSFKSILETNPGIAGVWLCGLKRMTSERRTSHLYLAAHRLKSEWTEIEHPGDLVNIVAKESGLTPGTLAWKKLVKMPAHEAYEYILSRTSVNRPFKAALKAMAGSLEVQVLANPNRNENALRKVESVITADRVWKPYVPLFREYLRMSGLPARDRGITLRDLHDEFIVIMDWAREMLRMEKERGSAEDFVLTPKKWNGFRKASARWHREITEEATLQSRLDSIAESGTVRSWTSEIPRYNEGKYTITPLVNEMQLAVEAKKARNCVAGEGYIVNCLNGHSRIFAIEQILKQTSAGEKSKHLATVEISNRNLHRTWDLRQVQGHKNSRVSDSVRKIAKGIVDRYNEATLTSG